MFFFYIMIVYFWLEWRKLQFLWHSIRTYWQTILTKKKCKLSVIRPTLIFGPDLTTFFGWNPKLYQRQPDYTKTKVDCFKIKTLSTHLEQGLNLNMLLLLQTAAFCTKVLLQKRNKRVIKTDVFVKHECPRRQKSPKLAIFSKKGQGHKVIILGVIWKGFISWVCMPLWRLYFLRFQSYGQG